MSIPLVVGLLVRAIVIAAAAGVWRARGQGQTNVQSSLMMLAVVVVVALVIYFLLTRST